LKEVRGGPYITGIIGDINGQIPNELYAQGVYVCPESLPLFVELRLEEKVEGKVFGIFLLALFHGYRISQAKRLGPTIPGQHIVMHLDGHEQGIVLCPRIFSDKGCGIKVSVTGKCFAEQGIPCGIQLAVIHTLPVGDGLQLLGAQEPFFHEKLRVDKIGIPPTGRNVLIGAVPIACRAYGKKLPIFLPGGMEKVCKCVCLLSQCADAIDRGEGADVKQDTCGSHIITPFVPS
jgi:hypothetical protein